MRNVAFVLMAAMFLWLPQAGNAAEHPHYNRYITKEQREIANTRAKEIAAYVMAQRNLTTDFQRVRLATTIISRIAS